MMPSKTFGANAFIAAYTGFATEQGIGNIQSLIGYALGDESIMTIGTAMVARSPQFLAWCESKMPGLKDVKTFEEGGDFPAWLTYARSCVPAHVEVEYGELPLKPNEIDWSFPIVKST